MLLRVPAVLTGEQLGRCRQALAGATWIDGRASAGHQSALVKDNQQLAENDPVARELGDVILRAREEHPLFLSAALPLKDVPPLFNRYEGGGTYGTHID